MRRHLGRVFFRVFRNRYVTADSLTVTHETVNTEILTKKDFSIIFENELARSITPTGVSMPTIGYLLINVRNVSKD